MERLTVQAPEVRRQLMTGIQRRRCQPGRVYSSTISKTLLATRRSNPWSLAAQDGVTWAMVRERVTYIQFGFTGEELGPVEVYLDDIRLRGIGYDAFGFNYSEP